jgi:competence protein ComEA
VNRPSYFAMNKAWWLGGFVVVGILLGTGIIFLVTRPPRGEPVTLLPAPTAAPITVYVSGSVVNEGLYALPRGSRANDAIQAAGGLTQQANTSGLNLAKVLEDGEQIIVPDLGSTNIPDQNSNSGNFSPVLIDINCATVEQLDTLPGIGPKTAQDILDYRTDHGPFTNIEQLMDVPGIGQVTFDKVKDLVSAGTPP